VRLFCQKQRRPDDESDMKTAPPRPQAQGGGSNRTVETAWCSRTIIATRCVKIKHDRPRDPHKETCNDMSAMWSADELGRAHL